MWFLSVCSVSFFEIPFPDGSLAVPSCPCFRAVLFLPSPGTAPFQLSVFTLGLQAFVLPSSCNVFPQMFRWFGPSLYSGLSPQVSCSKRNFPACSSLDLPSLPHHPSPGHCHYCTYCPDLKLCVCLLSPPPGGRDFALFMVLSLAPRTVTHY